MDLSIDAPSWRYWPLPDLHPMATSGASSSTQTPLPALAVPLEADFGGLLLYMSVYSGPLQSHSTEAKALIPCIAFSFVSEIFFHKRFLLYICFMLASCALANTQRKIKENKMVSHTYVYTPNMYTYTNT